MSASSSSGNRSMQDGVGGDPALVRLRDPPLCQRRTIPLRNFCQRKAADLCGGGRRRGGWLIWESRGARFDFIPVRFNDTQRATFVLLHGVGKGK